MQVCSSQRRSAALWWIIWPEFRVGIRLGRCRSYKSLPAFNRGCQRDLYLFPWLLDHELFVFFPLLCCASKLWMPSIEICGLTARNYWTWLWLCGACSLLWFLTCFGSKTVTKDYHISPNWNTNPALWLPRLHPAVGNEHFPPTRTDESQLQRIIQMLNSKVEAGLTTTACFASLVTDQQGW